MSQWMEFGFHEDHCKQSLLTNSKNYSQHFMTCKAQSLSFGGRGTVGYLTGSTSRVCLLPCDGLADHTSLRYPAFNNHFSGESNIIIFILGYALTITKIQWWLSHTGITRYFLEKTSVFFWPILVMPAGWITVILYRNRNSKDVPL